VKATLSCGYKRAVFYV